MAAKRRSKVFTISMPPEMATAAELLAKFENRTMSELMREAFREYHRQRIGTVLDEIGRQAERRNSLGYSEEDVERLVKESRSQTHPARQSKIA